jgi:hypothetical protein
MPRKPDYTADIVPRKDPAPRDVNKVKCLKFMNFGYDFEGHHPQPSS